MSKAKAKSTFRGEMWVKVSKLKKEAQNFGDPDLVKIIQDCISKINKL
jgi:hypothetical protein